MARKPETGRPARARKSAETGGTPPKKTRGKARKAGDGGARIRVRMYRQGLGDCFLVSLLGQAKDDFHLMIDCGVLPGTPDAGERMKAVVASIAETTGGRVDVLAVTHEHYDHVAGFLLAEALFAAPGEPPSPGKLAVGEVWFAWTEDPENAEARRLRADRVAKLGALAGLAQRIGRMSDAERAAAGIPDEDAEPALAALAFFGISGLGKDMGDDLGATAKAMAKAASLAPAGKLAYRRPGEVLEPRSAPGLRIYILGPPDDAQALGTTDSATAVYHIGEDSLLDAVRLAAVPGGGGGPRFTPFAPAWTRPLAEVMAGHEAGPLREFLSEHYFGSPVPTPGTDIAWRRIDRDWLNDAGSLGMALDSATNNTSLAMAIELTGSGAVLLFPADAQVGSILSWHALDWGAAGPGITTDDLLRRTVFYKVGHHGSRNATLKERELELMPREGLAAFIPVDRAAARKRGWGGMPEPKLVEALRARCGNRLALLDEDLPEGAEGMAAGPDGGPYGSLYYDWTMKL